MKVWLLLLLLLGVLLSAALAGKKRSRERKEKRTFRDMEQMDDNDDDDDDDDDNDDADDDNADEQEIKRREKSAMVKNPCEDKTCRRGETCIVDKKYRARCACYSKCLPGLPGDDRYQVCSKRNITYESECALDRDHCLCRRQLDGCSNPKYNKIRLDYFGPCEQLTPCSEREFKEFPRRTREWLFIVMKEMAGRSEMPREYRNLLKEASQEVDHSHAVLWKFCDLDVSPHDRFVSRRELLYTIQSLKALEHCLIPFLDSCDADSDGQITLWEWGRCLQLGEEQIKDVCKAVHKGAGRGN